MLYYFVFAGLAVAFFALQMILSIHAKHTVIKCIPAGCLILCLLFCLVVYLNMAGTPSESVIAENQVFAKALAVHVAVSLAGCAAGAVFAVKGPRH